MQKKIKVVSAVAEELGLENVVPMRKRMEEEKDKFDFVVSRAVTAFPGFVSLASKNIRKRTANSLENGIIYLKGGDLKEELSLFRERIKVWQIGEFFSESFFETKVIVYLPL